MVRSSSLVSLGQLSWIHSLPTFFSAPVNLLCRVGEDREKTLTLCKNCSAIAKTPLCYPHCFNHKCKAQHHTGSCEGSWPCSFIPAKPRRALFQVGSKRMCRLSSVQHLCSPTVSTIFHCHSFLYHCSDYSWRSLSLLGHITIDHSVLQNRAGLQPNGRKVLVRKMREKEWGFQEWDDLHASLPIQFPVLNISLIHHHWSWCCV